PGGDRRRSHRLLRRPAGQVRGSQADRLHRCPPPGRHRQAPEERRPGAVPVVGRPPRSEREPYDVETMTDIALRLFHERGYDATSIADIARAAGVTKSSIYQHVQGKVSLIERGVKRDLQDLCARLTDTKSNT